MSSLSFLEMTTWMTTSVENSLPAFSKNVAKLSLQLYLTIDPSFLQCGTPLHCYTRPSKVATCRHQCFPRGLYHNYSNYGPLFLIIQFFCFFNSVNQNCGSVGPEKQQINLEWPNCTFIQTRKHDKSHQTLLPRARY